MKSVMATVLVAILDWVFRRFYGPVLEHFRLKKRFEEIEAENRRLREQLEKAETPEEIKRAARDIAKNSF